MRKFTTEAYEAKAQSIFSRFPSVQKESFSKAYKPGLDNMVRFCEILGNPQTRFRSIHVAGTNGKGSVANMLASALSAVGLKTGLYTSPHIKDFRERMRIGGEMVDREYVYDFLCRYEKTMESLGLSFFEITTGLAFKWFADSKADVAVVEVGLGGRLDSTNVITPDLAIVTSIALDHCSILGNTLEAIAGEKAGIFKKNVPALVGEWLPETRPVFEAKADGLCPLRFAQDAEPSLWTDSEELLKNMDLRGEYQRKNLRTVLAAVDMLTENPFYEVLRDRPAVEDAIVHTASRMDFCGRWEHLSENPLVIADIGHNPAALKENFEQLRALGRPLVIVYAVMADKDLDGIMPLMPEDADYVLTSPDIHRALPAEELAARFNAFRSSQGLGSERVHAAPTVRQAVEMALELAGGRKAVYIGGSTYLVSEAVEILKETQALP